LPAITARPGSFYERHSGCSAGCPGFLAPELRAIAVQIESLNKRTDSLEANIGIQFAAAKTEASSRQEVVVLQIEHARALLDVDKRLLRLEIQRADPLSKGA
jgi:hypothetical protein